MRRQADGEDLVPRITTGAERRDGGVRVRDGLVQAASRASSESASKLDANARTSPP
jgi:hypothetical protein